VGDTFGQGPPAESHQTGLFQSTDGQTDLCTRAELAAEEAWQVFLAYARHWQIETAFRFFKSELALESSRLWLWHNRLKLFVSLLWFTPFSLLCSPRSPHPSPNSSLPIFALEPESGTVLPRCRSNVCVRRLSPLADLSRFSHLPLVKFGMGHVVPACLYLPGLELVGSTSTPSSVPVKVASVFGS
jgi:hypothetical protein